MNNFIPKNLAELLDKMTKDNFKGNYEISDNELIWNINDRIFLRIMIYTDIDEGLFSLYCSVDEEDYLVDDFKISMKELYLYLTKINNERQAIVITRGLLTYKFEFFMEPAKGNLSQYINNDKYEIIKF